MLEAGANVDTVPMDTFIDRIKKNPCEKLEFLQCVKRMHILHEDKVSMKLLIYYYNLLDASIFDESKYTSICQKELDELFEHGMYYELSDNFVDFNFSKRFFRLIKVPHLFDRYPNYGP